MVNFLERLNNYNGKNILVIGGATRGSGTQSLWESNQIDITSLDLVGTENQGPSLITESSYLLCMFSSIHLIMP